jgi:hypothetical protein
MILVIAVLCGLVPQVYAADMFCGMGVFPCGSSPIQGMTLFNTQTTGAATTAVTVTLTAVVGQRSYIHSVEARCNTAAQTSDVLVSDGGTTIWSSGALAVTNATPNFRKDWPTALTGATNSQVLVTLAACTGGTGTLIVQADKW